MRFNRPTTHWTVHAQALGLDEGEVRLYMPGTQSGATYGNRWDKEAKSIWVPKCDAGTWFREHLPEGARIFLKINCEGGEVGILDSLATLKASAGPSGRCHRPALYRTVALRDPLSRWSEGAQMAPRDSKAIPSDRSLRVQKG